MKHIIAINGSPRAGWNTAALVREAAKGAESAGAQAEVIDLYQLEKFTGCVSCFGCKLEPNLGKCVYRDGLAPVLEKIRQADGLILGSPNYLSNITAGLRSLYERLIFQYISYKKEPASYSQRKIPVLFIMTSNAGEDAYDPDGFYSNLVSGYQSTLTHFIGPTKTLIYPATMQVKDYSRFNWSFDPEERKARHETVLPEKEKDAFALGTEMVTGPWETSESGE